MVCKLNKYEMCDQNYTNGCGSCSRNLPQANVKPQLCDGWRDVNDKPDRMMLCLVALTNGDDAWVREAKYDCYIKEFRTPDSMNNIESRDENGENGVWVYKWRELPDPPAFA